MLRVDGMFRWCVSGEVGDDGEAVAGTLEIAENGNSTLSLVGLLSEGDAADAVFNVTRMDAGRCIFGVLKDNRYVFLRRLENGGATLGGAVSHQSYRAREALVFGYLEDVPNLDEVTSLQIGLDALGDWASEPAVEIRRTRRGVTARASTPNTQTFKLSDKTVRLKTYLRHPRSVDSRRHSVTIEQEVVLEVKPRKPFSLEAIRKEFLLLEDLLLLLADVDVALPWPAVQYGKRTARFYFTRRRSDTKKIDTTMSWAALHWKLTTDVGSLLSNLQAQQDSLGPGLYLYLGIRRSPALYLENKFSTAVFGLESLHRRVGFVAEQEKLQEKISRIVEEVKLKKDREWLMRRLRNASEPSLEERLFLTFSELEIGLDAEGLRKFSRECADMRNQVAHFGGQRDGHYSEFIARMRLLNEAIRLLYHAVLLNRIGFDRDRIWAYFHRSLYSRQRKGVLQAAGLKLTVSHLITLPQVQRSQPSSDVVA